MCSVICILVFSYFSILQGVPIRVELGPRDIKQNQLVAVRRDTAEKLTLKNQNIGQQLKDLLKNIQNSLFNKLVCIHVKSALCQGHLLVKIFFFYYTLSFSTIKLKKCAGVYKYVIVCQYILRSPKYD